MSILHLTLKKQYFNEILKGTKTVEYRTFNKYWVGRLLRSQCIKDDNGNFGDSFKDFNHIVFYNGGSPSKKYPHFSIEFLGTTIARDIETPLGKGDFFVIRLGEILEDGRLSSPLNNQLL